MAKNPQNSFLNMEKYRFIQSQIHLLKVGEKEVKDQSKLLQKLYQFYEKLFLKIKVNPIQSYCSLFKRYQPIKIN